MPRAKSLGVRAPHPGWVLTVSILASSLAMIDGSVVNVGLPAVGRDLQAGASDLQWVVNAYLLPLSALLLFGGALGDQFGRKKLLIVGVALFALASAACAVAPNVAWLWAMRGLQGAGAAILLPNSLAVLGAHFTGEARGRAIGIWAASSAAATAVGPPLGGWLIDTVGWRSIFLLNLPVAAGAVVLALIFLSDPKTGRKQTPLDLGGAALITLSLGFLAWGLTVGSGTRGWTPLALAGIGLGLVLLVAFVLLERHRGDRAMTPLALFGSMNFVGLSLLTLLLYGVMGGMMVVLPYVLIEAGGYSALKAGSALLPFPFVLGLVSPVMGSLAGRFGSRLFLIAGPTTVALGVLLALRIDRNAGYWLEVAPSMFLIALGMSATAAPLTTAVISAVDEKHSGAASGLNSALSRTGGLIATALLGGVLADKGSELIKSFHASIVVGAVVCLAAGACGLMLKRRIRS